MSNPGRSFTDVPQAIVGASDAKVGRAFPSRTNTALQLAGSLANLNPKLAQLGYDYLKEDQQVQSAAAKKAALETGGTALADAVRDGKLEATQNPYFIQDYNRESAYVRAQNELAKIRVDSQTWPESGDPQQFQARYLKEVKAIGEQYTDPDSQEGFSAAAYPAMQQDFAANTAEKVAQIKADRISVMSNLVAQQIQSEQTKAGGAVAPGNVWNGISPLKEQFLSTGGSPQEWDKLVVNGVTAAALSQQDPNLLDILKDNGSGTSGALYNSPGVAQAVETTKYRIQADKENKGRQAFYDAQQADYLAGRQATQALYDKFGVDAFTGKVQPDAMVQALTDAGMPVAGITGALNRAQASSADFQGLAEARLRGFIHSESGQAELYDLNMQARTQGYTPELETRVGQHVLGGDIPASSGDQIIGQAIETSKAQHGGRVSGDLRRALRGYTSTGSAVDQSVRQLTVKVNQALTSKGAHAMTPAEIADVTQTARNVANYYLQGNPGDYTGAVNEAQRAMTTIVKQTLERRLKSVKQAKPK